MSIQVKRGLAINLPTLKEGELGFTTDSYEVYIGSDNGNVLLNNGEVLIRRSNGYLQYAYANRKNQWFNICSLDEIKGDKGDKGEQGIQGIQGKQGIQGERGLKGDKGDAFRYSDFTSEQLAQLKGAKGDQGSKGEKGNTGDKGDRGVGLQYSWSGTRLGVKRDDESQYLYTDLKGQQGAQGIKGEPGTKGEKGDTPSIAHLETQISNKSKELDTKFESLTSKQQQDAEVINARDGEVSLNARLERDLKQGKVHFETVEGSNISTDSQEGYLKNVEIKGNTIQDANNLADIRSVGDKVEGQELYKIPLLCTGKNLFNDKFTIAKGTWDNQGTPTEWQEYWRCDEYIRIDASKTLLAKCKYDFAIVNVYRYYYDKNKAYIGKSSSAYDTPPSNAMFVRLTGLCTTPGTAINLTKVTDIQLEEGTQATPYEPYQEHKLTILSPVQIEKVGTVADRIVEKDGVWGVEKNVESINLNKLKWNRNVLTDGVRNWYTDTLKSITIPSHSLICNTLPNVSISNNIKGIRLSTTGNITILLNEADTNDWDLSSWSMYDNSYIKYITTTPTFIPLPHSQQIKLRTFANKTNISFLCDVEGTIKADVPKSLDATVNTHTTQIDNLNNELDRVKKLEESTVSTVITDKDFEVVEQTTQGYFEDVELKGKTLVNLISDKKSGIKQTIVADGSNKTIQYTCADLEIGKTYTFICYISRNTLVGNSINMANSYTVVPYIQIPYNSLGLIVKAVTIAPAHINRGFQQFVVLNNCTSGEIDIDNYMVLEGDHTQNPPSCFEGLKSVGDGTDEIVVSSVDGDGNLFDGNVDKTKCISGSSSTFTSDPKFCISNYIRISDKHSYVKRGTTGSSRVMFFDNNKNIINAQSVSDEVAIKPLKGSRYIVFNINVSNLENHIQFTREPNANKHIEYKSDEKKLLYFDPSDNTWKKPILDEFSTVKKGSDGVYRYYKRGEKVVLNGSENWSTDPIGGVGFCVFTHDNKQAKKSGVCVSDKFPYANISFSNIQTEKIKIGGSGLFYISIKGSKLTTQDVAGFKSWLQANPTTVVYQLATEQVYECTNIDLITYQNETNYMIKSGVLSPQTTLKVHSNISNVVSLLQKKVSLLESHQNNMFKMVLSGNMLGLAQCLYPEDFVAENTIQVLPYEEESDVNE